MLLVAATPIGNLGDATTRLREALASAPVIAAEDTRSAQRLLAALDVRRDERPRLVAVHEHTEDALAPELAEQARDVDVLLLTDAGMPTVSDPGYRLVQAAIAAGVPVTVLPGPSAVLTALALSGLPTDRFAFDGFLPRKQGERRAALRGLADERRTVVLFESPHRIADALADVAHVLGDRPVAVARELTKRFEEVRRGTAAELEPWAREGVKGEIVLVIGGAQPAPASLEDAVADVLARVAAGERLKEAAGAVAERTGRGRSELYDAALAVRRG
ncbi:MULTISPECIES: 16S rRNA (cytidine(1402)-2'-O)-methyltransferase [unclassified Agrococcus]|uniref:16S rRNA (cytidine(1402)-2'-O)-methyltransferase n=1 Tax=unclassified Agrococcus TaxID=2615065 RepID=UPI003620ECF6